MCLSYVDKIPQKHRVRRRWKLFSQGEDGTLHSYYFSRYINVDLYLKEAIPVGVWLDEKDFRKYPSDHLLADSGVEYRIGWHCFEEELPCNTVGTVREVCCRKIVATGGQNLRDVTVAKYMMVLPLKEEGK